jgi:hypothetical protein
MAMSGTPQVVTAEERALLLLIARCPMIAEALVAGHPCSEIVAAQQVAERDRQVPEGWAGNLQDARVVFVSSNPSISQPGPGQSADQVEPFPTASSSDDQIVEFIGRRFDQTVLPKPWVRNDRSLLRNGTYWHRPTRFWVAIRARARELLGDDADPARNYVMTDVVHCKSRYEIGVAAAASTCAQRYLEDILRLSAAPLIAVVGKKAHATLMAWLPWLPEPPYITAAELGGRPRMLVYVSHPSSWGEPKTIRKLYGPERLAELRTVASGHAAELGPAAGHTATAEVTVAAGGADTAPQPPKSRRGRRRPGQGRVAGEPIQPVPGRLLAISEISGQAIIAARESVLGVHDPAIRVFTGDIASRKVGDTFDSHHKVNKMPCGTWTIIATVEAGRLTGGYLPEGTRKLRVNSLG